MICKVCGEREAEVGEMCRKCYNRLYYVKKVGADKLASKASNEMCSVCGKREAEVGGMCRKCYNKLYYMKRAGTNDKPKYSNTFCRVCGKRRAEIAGMCRTCYSSQNVNVTTKHSKEIISDYQGGMSQSEVARKNGISRQRVSQIIKRYKELEEELLQNERMRQIYEKDKEDSESTSNFKVFLVDRTNVQAAKDLTCGRVIAMVNLKNVTEDFCNLFSNEVDFVIEVNGEITCADKNGTMKCTDEISNVESWYEKNKSKINDRRLSLLYSIVKSFNDDNWGDCRLVLYRC